MSIVATVAHAELLFSICHHFTLCRLYLVVEILTQINVLPETCPFRPSRRNTVQLVNIYEVLHAQGR